MEKKIELPSLASIDYVWGMGNIFYRCFWAPLSSFSSIPPVSVGVWKWFYLLWFSMKIKGNFTILLRHCVILKFSFRTKTKFYHIISSQLVILESSLKRNKVLPPNIKLTCDFVNLTQTKLKFCYLISSQFVILWFSVKIKWNFKRNIETLCDFVILIFKIMKCT